MILIGIDHAVLFIIIANTFTVIASEAKQKRDAPQPKTGAGLFIPLVLDTLGMRVVL